MRTKSRMVALACGIGAVAVGAFGLARAVGPVQAAQPAQMYDGSTLYLQNLDPTHAATITVRFRHESGGPEVVQTLPALAPLAGAVVAGPDASAPVGVYAATLQSDRPVGGVVRTQWAREDAAAAYVPAQSLASELVVPVVMRGANQRSVVSVYNPDAMVPVSVTLTISAGPTTVALFRRVVAPGGLAVVDFGAAPELAGLPLDLVGLLTLRADHPVAATSLIRGDAGAAYHVDAWPVAQADTTLMAPVVRRTQTGSTSIVVANPGTAATEVSLHYTGVQDSCSGASYVQGPVSVAAGGLVAFSQSSSMLPETGRSPLPQGCVAWAEIISSAGPVMATVFDVDGMWPEYGFLPQIAMSGVAYAAFGRADLARRISMPCTFRNWSNLQLNTGLAFYVGGPDAARAAFTMFTGSRLAPAYTALLPAGGHGWWFGPSISQPPPARGPAVLETDQPIGALVSTRSRFAGSDSAMVRGIDIDKAGNTSYVPYFLRGPLPVGQLYLPAIHQVRR